MNGADVKDSPKTDLWFLFTVGSPEYNEVWFIFSLSNYSLKNERSSNVSLRFQQIRKRFVLIYSNESLSEEKTWIYSRIKPS